MMFLFNILYFYGHLSSRWVFLAYSVLPILMFFLNFYIFPTSSKSPTSPPGQELVEHTSENHQNIINEKESRYKEAIGSDPLLFDDSDEFDNISNSHSLDDEISSIISLIKIGPWLPEKSFCSILSSSLFWLSALWLAGILLPFPPPFYLFPLLLPPFLLFPLPQSFPLPYLLSLLLCSLYLLLLLFLLLLLPLLCSLPSFLPTRKGRRGRTGRKVKGKEGEGERILVL